MLAECESSAAMLKVKRAHAANITQAGWRPTWKTTGRRISCLPAHKIVILLIFSCGAKLTERSINALISPWPPSRSWPQLEWLTLTARSSFMPARSSSLGLRLLWRPLGFLSNKCVCYMHIYFPWNFHQNVLTLTIFFIGWNASIWFVLIYRPHPVLVQYSRWEWKKLVYSDLRALGVSVCSYTIYEEDGARELADKCISVSIEV